MKVVLIAEDEEALLEVFSSVVTELGHTVLAAHAGDEALGLARRVREIERLRRKCEADRGRGREPLPIYGFQKLFPRLSSVTRIPDKPP